MSNRNTVQIIELRHTIPRVSISSIPDTVISIPALDQLLQVQLVHIQSLETSLARTQRKLRIFMIFTIIFIVLLTMTLRGIYSSHAAVIHLLFQNLWKLEDEVHELTIR